MLSVNKFTLGKEEPMSKQWNESTATAKGLYDPRYEHDNCGIGAVVNIKGIKTHETVENALKIVENLKHRAGKDADGKTGDGVGILLQISHKFFKKVTKPLGIELGEITVWECFSSLMMSSRLFRQKRCLRLSWRRKVLNFSDGEKCLQSLISFLKKPETVCHASCSAL